MTWTLQRFLELDVHWSSRLRVAERPGLLRTIAAFLAHSGDSWLWLGGAALIWLVGSPYWKWRALIVAVCTLGLALLVLAIKFTVRRRRPQGEWGEFYRNTDPHSFPSGHAARAIMLAVVLSGLGPTWLAILLWVWVPLVSLARVAMGVHYLSDVIAGLLLGGLIGNGIVLSYF